MTITGVALKMEQTMSMEEKLHMILEKADQGDLEAIKLLEQINSIAN